MIANDPTVLRQMLRLARKWRYLDRVPNAEFPKRARVVPGLPRRRRVGRVPTACRRSRNPYLETIVTVALNTGIRKASSSNSPGTASICRRTGSRCTGRRTEDPRRSDEPRHLRCHGEPTARCRSAARPPLPPIGSARVRSDPGGAHNGAHTRGDHRLRFHDLRDTAAPCAARAQGRPGDPPTPA